MNEPLKLLFAEYTVRVMLEGQIETSYTKADNKCVVTTDSMKNTVNGEPPMPARTSGLY